MLNFELLDNRVFGENYINPHRFVSYSLPRQSGTTTYLVNKYNELKSSGNRVLFVTPRYSWTEELVRHPRINASTGKQHAGVISLDDGKVFTTILDSLRGTGTILTGGGYDYVLMDNTKYDYVIPERRNEIINTLLTLFCKNTILEINTVE